MIRFIKSEVHEVEGIEYVAKVLSNAQGLEVLVFRNNQLVRIPYGIGWEEADNLYRQWHLDTEAVIEGLIGLALGHIREDVVRGRALLQLCD